MATLADILRQTGYSQGNTLSTPTPVESPMTKVLADHIASLPQKFEENQANQMALLNQAFPGNTYESMMTQGDPKAFAELAMQVPAVGMTKALSSAERMALAQRNAALPISEGGLGLSPNNTQWQRAEAMGFNVREPMYHGTQKEFTQFDLSKHGSATDKGDFGKAVYVTTDPEIAKVYAFDSKTNNNGSQIMPLLIKEGKQYKVAGQQGMNELIQKLGGEDKWFDLTNNPDAYAKAIKELGYDTVRDRGYAQTAVYDPSSIRSKFAAFDPKRIKEADILAAGLAVPMPKEDKKTTRKEKITQEIEKALK